MKSTASLTGREYFSFGSMPSNRIAPPVHLILLGSRPPALIANGERTHTSSKTIKRLTLLLLPYLCDTIASSAESLEHLWIGESGKRMIQDDVHGPYGEGFICALSHAALTVRLGQDRRECVLESRTVRVSEGAVCGLQPTMSTENLVPFLAGLVANSIMVLSSSMIYDSPYFYCLMKR